MSTNILKKLVEQFAPETVKEQLAKVEDAERAEREARLAKIERETDLLDMVLAPEVARHESRRGLGRLRLNGTMPLREQVS